MKQGALCNIKTKDISSIQEIMLCAVSGLFGIL